MDVLKDISSSAKFLTWLQSEKITLAISTYQTNCLFLIGTFDDGQPAFVPRIFPHVMGLYPSSNGLWLSTKTEIVRLENILDLDQPKHAHQRLYLPRARYTTGDLDIHDLVIADRQVMFINSKYSCLATLDSQHSFKPLWQPTFISKLAPEDRCHLNGLALVEDKPKYVTAISRSDVTDGWRDNRQQGGVVIDIETDEIIGENLSMPHSPRYYQGKLWLHNSGTGHFGYLDLQTGKFEPVTFVPGYARGLAFWGNYALVGLSKPRDNTFKGLELDKTLEDKQAQPRCGLVVIDINTGNIVHWVWIEGQVRELYDIQIIPGVQRASIVEDEAIEDSITFAVGNTVIPSSLELNKTEVSQPVQDPKTSTISPEKLVLAKQFYREAKQLVQEQHTAAAINRFQTAIEAYPDYAAAYHDLGLVYWQLAKYDLAKECFERVIDLDPTCASAQLNLGNVWQQKQQQERAILAYQQAVNIRPDCASAWYNLGLVYKNKKQLEAAEIAFSRAIKEDKQYFSAFLELGKIWDFTHQTSKSKQLYKEALKRNPPKELQQQFISLLKIAEIKLGDSADYDLYEKFQQDYNSQLRQCIQGDLDHHQFNLFELLNLDVEPQLFKEIAQLKSQEISDRITKINFGDRKAYSEAKIRIGYISPDFRSHAVGRLIHDLFRHHNREQFEVYGYYLIGIEADEYTQKIEQGCDVFRRINDLSATEAARQINDDAIDILIDLAGYNYGSNSAILALQPAPVQISYLGYSATMGADFIQYILADEWLIPHFHQNFYTEKVLYLPHAFVGSPMTIPQAQISKSQFGLPEDSFIFTCTNNYRKINPPVFTAWMEILQAVPDSVLWLRNCPQEVQQNFRQNAAKHQIDPERLIFAAKNLDFNKYLQELTLADLFLDTFIYNAGSTAVACLQAGLPLLTKAGNRYVSRMGASICGAAGLESTICHSTEEYVQKAIALTQNPQQIQQLKQHLQQDRLPLFDLPQFAQHLESIYLEIYQRDIANKNVATSNLLR